MNGRRIEERLRLWRLGTVEGGNLRRGSKKAKRRKSKGEEHTSLTTNTVEIFTRHRN
jgi:hypothetical protein